MRWRKGRSSENVTQATGGGGRRYGMVPHVGIGGLVAIFVLSLLFHQNPLQILALLAGGDVDAPAGGTQPLGPSDQDDPQVEFVSRILGSTEDVWGAYFQQAGQQYVDPKLVLFHGQVSSACGLASSAVGPFYCPGDAQVYLDLDFFDQLATQFHSDSDFARAYVIAHEVGHHVQALIGVMAAVEKARRQGQPMEGADGLSVRQELQADCLAGVWANRSQQQLDWLQPGDVEAALNAASQIGDDTLQREAQGRVVPDSFTHGTSAQRVRWFQTGFQAGKVPACDTFKAKTL